MEGNLFHFNLPWSRTLQKVFSANFLWSLPVQFHPLSDWVWYPEIPLTASRIGFRSRRSDIPDVRNHKRVFRLRIFNGKKVVWIYLHDAVINDPDFIAEYLFIPDPFRFRLIGYSDKIIFTEKIFHHFVNPDFTQRCNWFLSEDNTHKIPNIHPFSLILFLQESLPKSETCLLVAV